MSGVAHLSDRTSGLLIDTVQKLSEAKSIDDVTAAVRSAARELVSADGATFVLLERGQCFYADENAISPLWKGKRFPIKSCISGWSMLNKQQVVIEDIYKDERIPHDLYRPTFVRSLVMTPVRKYDPIAAIGTYWATAHKADPEQTMALQTLANTTAVALANVNLYNELEQRVRERTKQLELANAELEAFAYSVSHDLRGPLRSIEQLSAVFDSSTMPQAEKQILHLIGAESRRLADLTDALLELCRYSFINFQPVNVDISQRTQTIIERLAASDPERKVTARIQAGINVSADPRLVDSFLENLLSNAWKYTRLSDDATIELRLEEEDRQKVTFSLRDNGAGFNMDQKDKLFQPFQRLHKESDFPGLGIGLATVKRIVTTLGGNVWATAAPNKGAIFYVTLSAATN